MGEGMRRAASKRRLSGFNIDDRSLESVLGLARGSGEARRRRRLPSFFGDGPNGDMGAGAALQGSGTSRSDVHSPQRAAGRQTAALVAS